MGERGGRGDLLQAALGNESTSGHFRMPLFPTPTAGGGGGTGRSGARSGGIPSLQGMASRGPWPTPTARLGDPRRGLPPAATAATAERRYAEGRRNLDDAVAMWPTPNSSGHKGQGQLNRTPLRPVCGDDLPTRVARGLWPTPTARDHMPAHRPPDYIAAKRAEGHGMANLNDVVAHGHLGLWPTPMARDHRSPNSPEGIERRGLTREGSEHLPNEVGGQLNPAWVEALMGFPPGWTEV